MNFVTKVRPSPLEIKAFLPDFYQTGFFSHTQGFPAFKNMQLYFLYSANLYFFPDKVILIILTQKPSGAFLFKPFPIHTFTCLFYTRLAMQPI